MKSTLPVVVEGWSQAHNVIRPLTVRVIMRYNVYTQTLIDGSRAAVKLWFKSDFFFFLGLVFLLSQWKVIWRSISRALSIDRSGVYYSALLINTTALILADLFSALFVLRLWFATLGMRIDYCSYASSSFTLFFSNFSPADTNACHTFIPRPIILKFDTRMPLSNAP